MGGTETRKRLVAALGAVVVALGLTACASGNCGTGPADIAALDPALPGDPEPGTRYCREWVPPTYRAVPKLVQTDCGCTEQVPEVVRRVRYRDECVRPRTFEQVCVPGKTHEEAVVETRAGGYRWVRDGDCWKYCFVPPCYKTCNKVVTEDGIRYCTEVPPEYRTVAEIEEVVEYRTVVHPPKYDVRWEQEVYEPARYEWRAQKLCGGNVCPQPCPRVPCFEKQPCAPGPALSGGVSPACPPCN